jgi:hypothetical protein
MRLPLVITSLIVTARERSSLAMMPRGDVGAT